MAVGPDGRTALYLRLSREDGDGDASESIKNQQAYLTAYARENGFAVYGVYADDGYTGTNFDRPGFLRMIADVEQGRIDTVITKDLSRLGRDYILTGHYIERFFPSRNVRYIAVNDNVDSQCEPNDLTPIRSVFNDYYARDISRKVKSALLSKKQRGAFIGSVPPYGYVKDAADKNRLAADAETAPHVRRIFALFLSGMKMLAIANLLTREGVKTPSEVKQLTATQRRLPGFWNDRIIRRILENPVYIGHMVQNKTEKKSYKLAKRTALPPEQWITVENTHEPIVTREDFEAVRDMLSVRRYDNSARGKDTHLLTGLAFCAGCGAPMATIKEAPARYYLVCRTWRRHAWACASHCIRESVVTSAIGEQLRALAERFIDANALADDCLHAFAGDNGHANTVAMAERHLRDNETVKLALYKDKATGRISEEAYNAFSAAIAREGLALTAQLEGLKRQKEERENTEHIRAAIHSLLTFEDMDRKTLLSLVKRVEIGQDKQISITFCFAEPP